jgi:hypothetical protein
MPRQPPSTAAARRSLVTVTSDTEARRSLESDSSEVRNLLRELLAGQQRILAALERLHGPLDTADKVVLLAIAEIGDWKWTSRQLMAHAAITPALQAALLAADVTDATDLGVFCRRVQVRGLDGIRLERLGECRDGVRWRVVVDAVD